MTNEPLTPTQMAGRIRASLATIRDLYDEVLEPTGRALHHGNAPVRADDADDSDDLPRTDRVIAVRQEVGWQVQSWAQMLVEDLNLDDAPRDTNDTPATCAWLQAHADDLATHDAGTDALEELTACAEALEHAVYGHKAPQLALCPCTDPTCDGTVRATHDTNEHGQELARCDRCHTQQTAREWSLSNGIHERPPLTKADIVALAHEQFGLTLSTHGITCLVGRGMLTPIKRDEKPHRFDFADTVRYLTQRRMRT